MAANQPIRSTGRYLIVGLLTAAPLTVTWLILQFLFDNLSRVGRPWANALALGLSQRYPFLSSWLLDSGVQSVAAIVIVLLFLYLLGWAATRVFGRRIIHLFEALIGRIPFVETIYRSIKRLLTVIDQSGAKGQQVVLIDFPSPDMKAVGLVTRIIRDIDSGEELAAVYVPTSPNPTSGYVEIVPVKDIIFTDWTVDQAMAFIVTGGTTSPDNVHYRRRGAPPVARQSS
ncbi:MAG TPA: DUF502 domain-containing protein [Hypericibacter adhaerens]|jgi:uncharacterized membrane protein|uniref:Membrane protein n=1 Tax=Hypericibacter adhaerens TaxID=2602016 RepID=A0A5J6N190_9PROT|nr:DUF502 domain-containing protein [Hypericibacter adhaerens]QEX23044.1 membrane protein [Hypericibacter adhaerens]HWA44225.1 DUF502 domain-containing protein [Hypericibacter adhaerens]